MNRLGIYIDGHNLYRQAWLLGPKNKLHAAKPDYEAVLGEALDAGDRLYSEAFEVVAKRLYTASRNTAPRLVSPFGHAMEKIGFDVRHHRLKGSAACGLCGRDDDRFTWSTKIMADVLMGFTQGEINGAIIVSGSADYWPLCDMFPEYEYPFTMMGFPGGVSPRLDGFTQYLTDKCLYGETFGGAS